MFQKKVWIPVLLVLVMAILTGCGGSGVYVQSVADLAALGGIAPGDRFAGLVVSEHTAQIKKDGERTIEELLVKEGDDVKEGQALFSYDTEEIQLNLDKQRLELEQLKSTIEKTKGQIADLEKQVKWMSGTEKLQYEVQIQSLYVDQKEAELNVKTKEAEVKRSEEILENATVVSPVTGRVQSINESGTDSQGKPLPYITIQQFGSYRVKGMVGELQRGGIIEGSRIRIQSRTHADQVWSGTVTLVDYENPAQGDPNSMYYGTSSDEMTAASRYPFYVELDSTEGLILGQHVYLELEVEESAASGPMVDMSFICYEEDGVTAYVWAEERGKLRKRPVTLGEPDPMTGAVEIVSGLTEDDYIAFPDPAVCVEGASTTYENVAPETTAPEGEVA